jgi:hypothetical protein
MGNDTGEDIKEGYILEGETAVAVDSWPNFELLYPCCVVGKDLTSGIIFRLLGMWRNWQTRMT